MIKEKLIIGLEYDQIKRLGRNMVDTTILYLDSFWNGIVLGLIGGLFVLLYQKLAMWIKGDSLKLQTIDLFDFDYLILGCGYVDRLSEHIDAIIKEEKDGNAGIHSFLFLRNWGHNSFIQPDHDDVHGAFMEVKKRFGYVKDSVCLKGDYGDVDFVVHELRNLRHCGCWGDKPSKVVSFVTKNGKRVLYEEYDTESG